MTELQRLAPEAYLDKKQQAAEGRRQAVATDDLTNERTRRVRESFINRMSIKLRRFILSSKGDPLVRPFLYVTLRRRNNYNGSIPWVTLNNLHA